VDQRHPDPLAERVAAVGIRPAERGTSESESPELALPLRIRTSTSTLDSIIVDYLLDGESMVPFR
jgi:hypothetical protein